MYKRQPQAEAQVRTTLLLEKIADADKIEITEEDINGEYDRMVKDYGMELDKVKAIVPDVYKRQPLISGWRYRYRRRLPWRWTP